MRVRGPEDSASAALSRCGGMGVVPDGMSDTAADTTVADTASAVPAAGDDRLPRHARFARASGQLMTARRFGGEPARGGSSGGGLAW